MHAKSAPTNITRNRLNFTPPPRLRGGKMTPRAAGRAAPAIKIAILALLLALVAGLAGIPTAGEVAAQGRDYASAENPNLIDITTLAQLDAIRYDLDGNGMQDGGVSDEDWAKHQAAFPNAAAGMGCAATCTGYELLRDLDFDENGDGALTPRGDPTYWNDGAGWIPIGAPPDFDVNMGFCNIAAYCYSATFDGNGHTISNLYINRHINNDVEAIQVGLFGNIEDALRNVGLVNPYISITRSGTRGGMSGTATRFTYVGGLAGLMIGGSAAIAGSWVDGGGITFVQGEGARSEVSVGCLLGRAYNAGAISASDATCAVHVTSPLRHTGAVDRSRLLTPEESTAVSQGKDTNRVYAGGLVGYVFNASITASYARGNVTCRSDGNRDGGDMRCAGLTAFHNTGTINSSYATGNVVNDAYFEPVRIRVQVQNDFIPRCFRIYTDSFHSAGLVGVVSEASTTTTRSYSVGRVDARMEGARCRNGQPIHTDQGAEPVNGLGTRQLSGNINSSYWDTQTSGIAYAGGGTGQTTAQLQNPVGYTDIYQTWNVDLDGVAGEDDPWDFGTAEQYPILKYGRDRQRQERQREPQPTVTQYELPTETETDPEPEEYVAPPIVYNLNIRFNVKGLTLDEGESATYRVRMSQPPVGHPARVAITSNNPDVVVAPTEVIFSSANYSEWQTVKVSTLRDPNDTDESATIAHRGPSLSYGSILVSVNDTWPGAAVETVNGHTVTVRHTMDAPYGVTVTAPDTLDADTDITIAGPPAGTPQGAPGYGLGESDAARMLADIRVSGTPADGLDICLPAPEALVTEAGEHPLTLLRYADGVWAPVAGSERRAAMVCAAGITEYGTFAAAYTLPVLGAVSDFAAAPGDTPGTITLTWTPGANAERHWLAGVKQSDLTQFAIWAAADNMGSHTVSNLEPGATYIFTVTAGRGAGDARQWSAWAPWATATAPAPTPSPTPSIKAPPSPLPQ